MATPSSSSSLPTGVSPAPKELILARRASGAKQSPLSETLIRYQKSVREKRIGVSRLTEFLAQSLRGRTEYCASIYDLRAWVALSTRVKLTFGEEGAELNRRIATIIISQPNFKELKERTRKAIVQLNVGKPFSADHITDNDWLKEIKIDFEKVSKTVGDNLSHAIHGFVEHKCVDLSGFSNVKDAHIKTLADRLAIRSLRIEDSDFVTDESLRYAHDQYKLHTLIVKNCPNVTEECVNELKESSFADKPLFYWQE